MKVPLVSIIIPFYNRENLITDTLRSIKTQTLQSWECILIDDGSSDNGFETAIKFKNKDDRFKVLIRPQNLIKGANSCRNYGLQIATGTFVQFFDSDDLLLKDALEIKVKFLIDNMYYGFSYCGFSFFNHQDPSKTINTYIPYLKEGSILNGFHNGDIILNTQGFLWRRSILKNIIFNDSLSRAQDLDFAFRVLSKEPINGKIISDSLIKIRLHSDSITNSFFNPSITELESEIFVRLSIFKTTIITDPDKAILPLFRLLTILKSVLRFGYQKLFLETIDKLTQNEITKVTKMNSTEADIFLFEIKHFSDIGFDNSMGNHYSRYISKVFFYNERCRLVINNLTKKHYLKSDDYIEFCINKQLFINNEFQISTLCRNLLYLKWNVLSTNFFSLGILNFKAINYYSQINNLKIFLNNPAQKTMLEKAFEIN